MKARDWQKYLEEQRRLHGKVLFTATELANVAAVSRPVVNVELARLRRQGVINSYAHGLYGLPDAVTPEILLSAIDSHAYITGSYVLYKHGLITQAPTLITCFTDRRSPRARERHTPVGRFVFICVRSRVYKPPADGVVAGPAQAFCDFVYLLRRRGISPESMVTFRALTDRIRPDLDLIIARYPLTVQQHVRMLVGDAPKTTR